MAGLPGSIPGAMPAGEDETQRRLRDLERKVEELGPSVARSFKPVLDALIVPESRQDTQGVFTLNTTQATISTVAFSVPVGYTKAAFVYTATCNGVNHSSSAASITVWPSWSSGSSSTLYGGPSGPVGAVSTRVVTSYSIADSITGLVPGNSLSFTTDAFASSSTFGSDTGVTVCVLVLWMR